MQILSIGKFIWNIINSLLRILLWWSGVGIKVEVIYLNGEALMIRLIHQVIISEAKLWIPGYLHSAICCYKYFVMLRMKRVTIREISFFSTVRQKKTIIFYIYIRFELAMILISWKKSDVVHNCNCNHKPHLLSCFSMIN